jgi:predicted metalloprotease with PDZ domain
VIARLTEAVQPAFRADRLRPEHLDDLPVGALRDAFTDANRELAMLEIAAHQEGWRDDPTLKEERLALRQSLLEYLGPEAYLAGLYATGRPNRLVLTNIAAGTDADSQGLQRGDVLLAVDGSRIFDEEGFAAVTASLPPGSPVTLEILRNGHSLRYVVENPRAGLRVYAQRVDPDNYYAAE